MVTILDPKMVPVYWDQIKVGIRACSEEQRRLSDSQINKVLLSILGLEAQVWLIYEEESPEDPYGFIITRMNTQSVDDKKQLWVYALYSFKPVPNRLWPECMAALEFFGRKNKCNEIIAYSNNPKVQEYTKDWMKIRYTVMAKNL